MTWSCIENPRGSSKGHKLLELVSEFYKDTGYKVNIKLIINDLLLSGFLDLSVKKTDNHICTSVIKGSVAHLPAVALPGVLSSPSSNIYLLRECNQSPVDTNRLVYLKVTSMGDTNLPCLTPYTSMLNVYFKIESSEMQ